MSLSLGPLNVRVLLTGYNWEGIRKELESVLVEQSRLPSFHKISPDQKRIFKGDQWKIFPLYVLGQAIEKNCASCPQTARLLGSVPHIENAMFSILAPSYRIPPHRGPTNGFTRIRLGLIVPDDPDGCQIRVHDQVFGWREGECVVFDVDRPMRLAGHLLNRLLINVIKRTGYGRDPLKNARDSYVP